MAFINALYRDLRGEAEKNHVKCWDSPILFYTLCESASVV